MTTQDQTKSPHLGAARALLAKLEEVPADPHTMATTAAAHATLVLAEQVAAVRIIMAGEIAQERFGNGQPAAQA